jgi:RNA polymerase sigma-70 factor, ECF subfamily
MLDGRLSTRLYADARAARWRVDPATFTAALEASAAKALGGQTADAGSVARYLRGLHLEDLALACACAAGDDDAWQHFVLTYRPALYRAADAIDPAGNARELADSLYADLFGLKTGGDRQPLFRYFHGRSSLATWLRAVLSQRHVDRMRERQKTAPLPDDESAEALPSVTPSIDPNRQRFVSMMRSALAAALTLLAPTDRLRLACYYAQQMTLAQVGRLLGEHEATVSRQIARTRKAIRLSVEQHLRTAEHLSDPQIDECFRSIADDPGTLDAGELLGRKESALDRSTSGTP